MKAFEWADATTISEAVQLLKSAPAGSDVDEAARPIAGGQDLCDDEDYTREYASMNRKQSAADGIQGNANQG